jgi:hypothetical protein
VYTPTDARWADPQKKSAVEQLCGGDGDDDGSGGELRDRE